MIYLNHGATFILDDLVWCEILMILKRLLEYCWFWWWIYIGRSQTRTSSFHLTSSRYKWIWMCAATSSPNSYWYGFKFCRLTLFRLVGFQQWNNMVSGPLLIVFESPFDLGILPFGAKSVSMSNIFKCISLMATTRPNHFGENLN